MFLRFGVEIEFSGIWMNETETHSLSYTGIRYDTYTVVGTDSSIQIHNYRGNGVEIRLGVFAISDAAELDNSAGYMVFTSALDKALSNVHNARTNRTCGLHVHVSTLDTSRQVPRCEYYSNAEHKWIRDRWRSRMKYASQYEPSYSHKAIFSHVDETHNHVEFRWPNGSLRKRHIHRTVRQCLRDYINFYENIMVLTR